MEHIEIEQEDDGMTFDIESGSSLDDEIELNNRPKMNRSIRRNQQPRRPMHNRYNVQKQRPPQRVQSHQPMHLGDDTFEMLGNPQKRVVHDQEVESEMSNDIHEQEDPNNMMEDNAVPDYHEYQEQPDEYEERPSPGFASVLDEKNDLLYKLYRIQLKGIPITKKFTVNSNLNEMRNEYNKIVRDMEVNASIKFSRRMLMACVTGVEFLNKRYDPFDVKLEGWSESVMESVDDYDNVFERLHDKYSSKVAMAPEIELLLTLAGSAFMFHLTNSMFKSIPNINDIAKQNPDFMKNIMKSMAQATTNATPPPMTETQVPQNQSNEPQNANGQREMAPPMFDLSHLSSMMGQGSLPMMPPPPVSARAIDQLPDIGSNQPVTPQRIVEMSNDDLPLSVLSDGESQDSTKEDSIKNISFSDLPEKPKRKYTRKKKN